MRVTHAVFANIMNVAHRGNMQRLGDVQLRMATGETLVGASDDPLTFALLNRLEAESSRLGQHQGDARALDARLERQEVDLGIISGSLGGLRKLVLAAADTGGALGDIKFKVATISEWRDSLVAASNRQNPDGQYLFSGTAVFLPPVAFDASASPGNRYAYKGNMLSQPVHIGNGAGIKANVSLDEVATALNLIDIQIEDMRMLTRVPPSTPPDIATARQAESAAATLAGMDKAIESLSGKVASIGGTRKSLSYLETSFEAARMAVEDVARPLRETDYVKASQEMINLTISMDVMTKVFARISRLSVFDHI